MATAADSSLLKIYFGWPVKSDTWHLRPFGAKPWFWSFFTHSHTHYLFCQDTKNLPSVNNLFSLCRRKWSGRKLSITKLEACLLIWSLSSSYCFFFFFIRWVYCCMRYWKWCWLAHLMRLSRASLSSWVQSSFFNSVTSPLGVVHTLCQFSHGSV